ncbi:MAG: DNA mismatch repair protein, partial [Bacteroidetes bacterium]|nr:DNA mismatch repair protein [Bacteroidota bacterium]
MNFEIDKQTFDDLNIFSDAGSNNKSIFSLFNFTATLGGEEKLRAIFNKPLYEKSAVKNRIEIIRYFQICPYHLSIDRRTCDFIEFYLEQSSHRSYSRLGAVIAKLTGSYRQKRDYYVAQQGVSDIIRLIAILDEFAQKDVTTDVPSILKETYARLRSVLQGVDFQRALKLSRKSKLNAGEIVSADQMFKSVGYDRVKLLLDIVYELDVYITVSKRGVELGYCLPQVVEMVGQNVVAEGLFHPFIEDPVPNDICIDHSKNIAFITGANMAGKSALLKAIGISIYLSQLGFPVPAKKFKTTTFKGLLTTINLSDNIHKNQSHFYSEVMRVKYVAEKMAQSGNLFVIFDELFRGTNVKDAYDASLAIITAFSTVKTSLFVISTHIVEVAN